MRLFLLLSVLSLTTLGAAEFAFHRNFQDHAVLQRNRPVEISGLAEPGAEVRLAIAPENSNYPIDIKQVTTTGDSGEWKFSVTLPAGGPISVTASCGEQEITLHDILVGEVWLLSGQSNMELPLWGDTPFVRVDDGEYLRSQLSKLPQIRYFDTQHSLSLEGEQAEPNGRWVAFHADEPTTISAVGYFFARQLYHDLQVPVGIIKGHWGGMLIRSFMSRDTLLECRPELVDYADSMVKS